MSTDQSLVITVSTAHGDIRVQAQGDDVVYCTSDALTFHGVTYTLMQHMYRRGESAQWMPFDELTETYCGHFGLSRPWDERRGYVDPSDAARRGAVELLREVCAQVPAEMLTAAQEVDRARDIGEREDSIALLEGAIATLRAEVVALAAGGRTQWQRQSYRSGSRQSLRMVVDANGNVIAPAIKVSVERPYAGDRAQ